MRALKIANKLLQLLEKGSWDWVIAEPYRKKFNKLYKQITGKEGRA